MTTKIPFVALVTCFDADENLNLDAVKRQVRRQIAAGNNIMCCGTNGDFSGLTFDDKVQVTAAVAEEAEGKVRFIGNAGAPSTYETIKLAKEFEKLGVDGIPIITPYFISCTQEGLLRHFTEVADAVSKPIYIYDFPARTHNHVEAETMAKLAEHPNIAGIKDSGGGQESLDSYLEIANNRDDFEVFSGPDSLIFHGLSNGAAGCISGLANVMPTALSAICKAFSGGDLAAAQAHQDKFSALRNDLFTLGFPPAVTKRSLYLMDKSVGSNRRPALIASPEMDSQIKFYLKKHGVWEA